MQKSRTASIYTWTLWSDPEVKKEQLVQHICLTANLLSTVWYIINYDRKKRQMHFKLCL